MAKVYYMKREHAASITFDLMDKDGFLPDLGCYDLICEIDTNDPEKVFDEMNVRPKDHAGTSMVRSMMTGDIVRIGDTLHFCDRVGWRKYSVYDVGLCDDLKW